MRIEDCAFRETGLSEIVIPSSVEFLGNLCFCDSVGLQSVTLEPESRLRYIGEDAFAGTSASLASLVLPRRSQRRCYVV
jgi:hypothetical protein